MRCVGGCEPRPDQAASDYTGHEMRCTPIFRMIRDKDTKVLPTSVTCRMCAVPTSQEVCVVCHRDLPAGWRRARTFTMTITGAAGTGKSVYIAVAVQMLFRYSQLRACIVTPFTQGTQQVYNERYFKPLYQENVVMQGTPSIKGGGAYQRDPLIWEIAGGDVGHLFLIMRDVAGEDLEHLSGRTPAFSFIDRADLVMFLFDPLMLDAVRQVLAGIIPDAIHDQSRIRPGEVLPTVLAQMTGPDKRIAELPALALTLCKFDALQQLPLADSPMAPALANPAAHFNWDNTMLRAKMPAKDAARQLEADSLFLDAEVRSLLMQMGEDAVTLAADQAVRDRKLAEIRHFAVSSLGDSPQHYAKLTERGISSFRVLDPILWGMSRAQIPF